MITNNQHWQLLCPCCAEKRKEEWQAKNKNVILKKGDFVQVEFKENEHFEYMWVRLESHFHTTQICMGELCNSPGAIKNIKQGDIVSFNFADICNLQGEKE